MHKHFATALLLLVCTGARGASGVLSAAPTSFRAAIGGFLGTTHIVTLENGALTYTDIGRGNKKNAKPQRITPSEKDWQEFRKKLDTVGVWKWQKSYLNRNVADGTDWSLAITYADRSLESKGRNAYPNANGSENKTPEATKTFSVYCAAVQALLGGRAF